MIDVPSTLRRLTLVVIAIAIAGVLCRRELSTMLVERGDVALVSRASNALPLYRRALFLDGGNGVAADRLLFAALLTHDSKTIAGVLPVADRFIQRNGSDMTVRFDRALCYQILRRYRDASRDFQIVGVQARDPRALLFAADDDERLGAKARAIAMLRTARRVAPAFVPAQRAFRRLETQ